jgi:fructokinase
VRTPIVVQHNKSTPTGAAHSFSLRCPTCGAWLPRQQPIRADMARSLISTLPTAQVFFFDRASRGALALAECAKAEGAVIVFEPASARSATVFTDALRLADIVKYSHDRLPNLFDRPGKRHQVLEIETLGEAGLRYRARLKSATQVGFLPAVATKVTGDAAGSGDWCTAVLLDTILREGRTELCNISAQALERALRCGQAAAAWNCWYEGARGGMYQVAPSDFRSVVSRLLERPDEITGRTIRSSYRRPRTRRAEQVCTACAGGG